MELQAKPNRPDRSRRFRNFGAGQIGEKILHPFGARPVVLPEYSSELILLPFIGQQG